MDKKNRLLMKKIENYIDEYTESHSGGSPSIREISEAVGCARTTAGNYLQYMRDEGIIEYHGCRNITTRKKQKTELAVRSVPLVGTIVIITGRRSRLSGGGGATCPDFRSHPA